jgi:hypothetical protein
LREPNKPRATIRREPRSLDLLRAAVGQRIGTFKMTARTLAAAVTEGDDARLLQTGVRRMLRQDPENPFLLDRRIAAVVEASDGSLP